MSPFGGGRVRGVSGVCQGGVRVFLGNLVLVGGVRGVSGVCQGISGQPGF